MPTDPCAAVARPEVHELLSRLADGDRSAFDPLFTRLWPLVRSYASLLLAPPDAEDAAQEALISILGRASEFDRDRDALAWVFGIVYWQCRTLRRRAVRSREVALDPATAERADPEPGHEARQLEREALAAAGAVLGQLGEQDRLTLLAAAGLAPRPRIAAATFRKRLQRARRRLRAILGIHHGTL